MNLAKQSTAKSFLVGPILDADGAAKTDEVIGSIKVTKNGSVGAPNGSSTLTHSHTGHYVYDAAAGDFDALGEVEFSLNSGTNAMAPVKFQVVPANVYDSLVSGSDALQVNTIQVGGTVQTAGDVVATANTIAADVVNIDGAAMRGTNNAYTGTPPTAAAIADAVYDEPTAGHVTAGTFGKLLSDLVTAVAAITSAIAALPQTAAAIAAAVWSYATRTLTQTSAAVQAALDGDTITIHRGDTLTVNITGLGDISTRSKLWISGKADLDHLDTQALFKVEETAGLQVINRATATTAANGSITVTDEVAGDLTLEIKGVETARLSLLNDGAYDIQWLSADGTDPLTLSQGELNVTLDVTRATS